MDNNGALIELSTTILEMFNVLIYVVTWHFAPYVREHNVNNYRNAFHENPSYY